jgi:RHH-type transcriptional regulator, rel operon repressor / antitoxin RelB
LTRGLELGARKNTTLGKKQYMYYHQSMYHGDIVMATSVRFSPETEERLNRLAKETGRAKSFYIRQMVESNIDDVEDSYLTDSVLERILAGKEKILSSASVRKELGLDD